MRARGWLMYKPSYSAALVQARMGDLLNLMMVSPLVMLAGMWILRWIVRGGTINLFLNPMLPEKSGGPNYGQHDPAPAVEWQRRQPGTSLRLFRRPLLGCTGGLH